MINTVPLSTLNRRILLMKEKNYPKYPPLILPSLSLRGELRMESFSSFSSPYFLLSSFDHVTGTLPLVDASLLAHRVASLEEDPYRSPRAPLPT
ncbi:hypothetical protein PMAYCL1PPCAC_09140 [Pristionchus mayeri]|uniref:Uncharacterized protein n=1 Tax=Pristionchus mayeri TaxID=1317129 RepID=A0AAN5CC10_9BILA|nr:hypothetical protein PMAYCL1PPCAC_09140 [Pristionchus mayeri]